MDRVGDLLQAVEEQANRLSGGWLDIVQDAFDHFGKAKASHVAAALAYYAVFSLFPLLLSVIATGSFFLRGELVKQQVVRSVTQVVPVSEDLILRNVEQVLEQRGTVGLVGLAGLLWSGTGVFTVLVTHVNQAWTEAKTRGFLKQRLLGLGIGLLGLVAVLLFLSVLSTPVLNILPRLRTALNGETSVLDSPLWTLISTGVPASVVFVLILNLYRWVPNTPVRWSEAAYGAGFVAFAWEVAKRGFAWYVSSDLVEYRLVYGSLGAVVALLLWIYLSSWLILFGAHLSAGVARARRQGDSLCPPWLPGGNGR